MNRFKVIGMICLASCMNSYAEPRNASSHPDQIEWGYGTENGPAIWGQLSSTLSIYVA